MAAKSKRSFNYVAHVQREGKVTEVAGTREDYSVNKVYHYLLQLAANLGGWLLAEQIVEEGQDEPEPLPFDPDPPACTYKPTVEKAVFEDRTAFGTYTSTYSGASQLTFKEK